jgi:2-polyprenyl-6-methoxyphenol hydroxylase-like FAD-dependent oxidoreductase
MEDAIALDKALASRSDVGQGLAAYEENRRPVLEKLLSGAHGSGAWYEDFAEHMRLAPVKFAMSYITRSGRVDIDRLRAISPRFVEQFERDTDASG